MITKAIGQAMATATTRHNDDRQKKLQVFHKALEIIKSETIQPGESKTVVSGPLYGKPTVIFLLKIGDKITLNIKVENETFQPLVITEVSNDNDYLAWNLKVWKEIIGSDEDQEEAPPVRTPRRNKIANPKTITQKAKSHDVTPLDSDTFRVKSGESGEDYFVRLLPNEDGGTCDCKWGKRRRYFENYKSACSHVQAVYIQLEDQRNRTVSAWSTKQDALRQHRQMTDLGDGVVLTLRKK